MNGIAMPALSTSPVRSTAGMCVEVDSVGPAAWSGITSGFKDASVYQTWPYATVRSGPANLSHLLLRKDLNVAAALQARLMRIPGTKLKIAYVFWGPLWQRAGEAADTGVFQQIVRALRTEYVERRKWIVRLVPNLHAAENPALLAILEAEGFVLQPRAKSRRTILVDLRPSLEELHRGLHQKWRYHLNKARKQGLELIEGGEDRLFAQFETVYREMLGRKQFATDTDPGHFRRLQQDLLPHEKLRVFLCQADGRVCAGGICSALGATGIYLFGATSNQGTKIYGSYLIHWRMLDWVRQQGCQWYDLNGINAEKNPGGHQFKTQLAGTHGREVQMLGEFDSYPNVAVRVLVAVGELLRRTLRRNH